MAHAWNAGGCSSPARSSDRIASFSPDPLRAAIVTKTGQRLRRLHLVRVATQEAMHDLKHFGVTNVIADRKELQRAISRNPVRVRKKKIESRGLAFFLQTRAQKLSHREEVRGESKERDTACVRRVIRLECRTYSGAAYLDISHFFSRSGIQVWQSGCVTEICGDGCKLSGPE